MKRFEDKIVLITGGTKGIGLVTAQKFVDEGAHVIVTSRNKHDFSIGGAKYIQCDISDFNDVKLLIDEVIKQYGRIDVLVNNAGIMKDRTTLKMSEEEFDSVIDINLKGTFNMVKMVGPLMQNQKYGSIINLSSFVAKLGNIGQTNYVASKAAIEGMTKCWAREFARHGENVRVNAVAPGVVLTDIFKDTPKDVIDGFADKTMLKRLAEPQEIANVILFLASDEASYITGSIIPVDGGIIL